MSLTLRSSGHAESRTRRIVDEIYIGAVLICGAVIVVSIAVLAVSHWISFANWIAIND